MGTRTEHEGLFKPGKSGNPAGKPKGTKSKFRVMVDEACQKYDANPAETIIRIMLAAEQNGDDKMALACATELLPYIAQRMKSVEVKGVQANEFKFNIIYNDSEQK